MGVVATLPLYVRLKGDSEFWPVYNLAVCKGFILVEILRSLSFVAYDEVDSIIDAGGKHFQIQDFVEIT